MGKSFLLILMISLGVVRFSVQVDFANKKVQVKRMAVCRGYENLPVKWSDLKIIWNEKAKEYTMSLNCIVDKEISRDFSMSMSFMKCDTAGNPDSCEYLIKDYKNEETCKFLEMKNQAWSTWIEHFDKPVTCPVKPGIYKNKNAPIKSDFLKFLPLPDALWKIKLFGYDKGKMISCVDGDILIVSNARMG